MKKTPSHDLFDLIKSLDKGEKRVFKLQAGLVASEREKRYIELFDMIERQDVYHEEKLQRHFKDLYGGQFAVAKNYLYKLILKSLSQHSGDPVAELMAMRLQAQTLIEKELYPQAEKLLKKALRAAEEIEAFHEWHQLLDLQVEILMRKGTDEAVYQQILTLQAQKSEVVGRIENEAHYRDIRARLAHVRTRSRSSPAAWKGLDFDTMITGDPMMDGPGKALSASARLNFYLILRLHALRASDGPADPEVHAQISSLLAEHPWLRARNSSFYIRELMYRCWEPLRAGRFEVAKIEMEAFREALEQNFPHKKGVRALYLLMQLLLGFYSGDVDTALDAFLDPEAGFAAQAGKMKKSTEAQICYLAAQLHFMRGDWRSALKWNNLCLNSPQEAALSILGLSRMLNLMIHMELGNPSIVDFELGSLRRFLLKHDMLGDYEGLLLKGMQKMMQSLGTEAHDSQCDAFGLALQSMVEADSVARYKDSTLRCRLWLRARSLRRSIAEILQTAPQQA